MNGGFQIGMTLENWTVSSKVRDLQRLHKMNRDEGIGLCYNFTLK